MKRPPHAAPPSGADLGAPYRARTTAERDGEEPRARLGYFQMPLVRHTQLGDVFEFTMLFCIDDFWHDNETIGGCGLSSLALNNSRFCLCFSLDFLSANLVQEKEVRKKKCLQASEALKQVSHLEKSRQSVNEQGQRSVLEKNNKKVEREPKQKRLVQSFAGS